MQYRTARDTWFIDSITQAFASVQSDIFKPTKYGGKYTVTLIPGTYIRLFHNLIILLMLR